MSALKRKGVEIALVAVLRECPGAARTAKALRSLVAERSDGCSPAEFAAAVQALRYAGKLEWDRLDLSDSMKEPGESAVSPVPQGDEANSLAGTLPGSAPCGPDDEDGEDYPGGVNDIAEEIGPIPAEDAPGDGSDALRQDERAVPCGRVEEPRSDPAGDQPAGAELPGQAARAGQAAGAPVSAGYGARRLNVAGGRHAASTRAGARPLPVPQHESEVARLVREEVEENRSRRRAALSTATVSQPLELRKFGVPDMSLREGVTSLLAEQPGDLMRAVSRKHPELWRRVILLGRAVGKGPAEALYWALERGLFELEAGMPARADAA